jgi:hypothetical protein
MKQKEALIVLAALIIIILVWPNYLLYSSSVRLNDVVTTDNEKIKGFKLGFLPLPRFEVISAFGDCGSGSAFVILANSNGKWLDIDYLDSIPATMIDYFDWEDSLSFCRGQCDPFSLVKYRTNESGVRNSLIPLKAIYYYWKNEGGLFAIVISFAIAFGVGIKHLLHMKRKTK